MDLLKTAILVNKGFEWNTVIHYYSFKFFSLSGLYNKHIFSFPYSLRGRRFKFKGIRSSSTKTN